MSERPCVLLVEDDYLIGAHVELVLEEAGFEVLGPVPSCRGALAHLDATVPDVAVLDYRLENGTTSEPIMDALDARDVPWVLLTADPSDGLGPLAERGAHPPLSKPLEDRLLIKVLNCICSRT